MVCTGKGLASLRPAEVSNANYKGAEPFVQERPISWTLKLLGSFPVFFFGGKGKGAAFSGPGWNEPLIRLRSYAEEALGPESPSANLTRQYLLDEASTVALKDLKVIQGHFSLWHTWAAGCGILREHHILWWFGVFCFFFCCV